MRLILSITLLLSAWLVAPYAAAKDVNVQEVDRRVKALMKRPDMSGLAIAIVQDGEIVFSKGYGVTEKGRKDFVTDDTVFRWASLSKSVAAATVLQLSEAGKIALQSPIKDYAPSLNMPESKFIVTVEDILSHRTGITNNAYDNLIEAGRPAKLVRGALDKTKRLCEPGACHTYQNVAFDAAAEAAETAAGLPYKSIVSQSLFAPLGMTTASITLEGLEQSAHWAKPHNSRGQLIGKVKPTYYRLPGAAGVNSSVNDLARWMMAQMGDNPAFSEFVRTSMHTPRMQTPYENRKMRAHYSVLKNSRYGLGWRIYDYNDHEVVGHRGAVEGYRSNVLFDPELKAGVALLWNSSQSRPNGLALEIMDQIYGYQRRDWTRLGGRQLQVLKPALSGSGG